MRRKTGLSPEEHIELGLTLKRARALLLEAGRMTRCYGRLSDEFYQIADSFMMQRAWLEKRLIEQVGDRLVEGVPARDVYFGMEIVEREDA
jgi:hypothetical protein